MERKVLLKALFGNNNYNLNDKDSDVDMKLFVTPNFEDLYYNKMYSASHVGEKEDYDVHDIRKLSELFWKSNINFIEILYSKEFYILPNTKLMLDEDYETTKLIRKIYDMKHEIVTINLPYLYNACKGMFYNKMGLLKKGTEGTKHLVEKFGFDSKQALNAYRVLDFLDRFESTNFEDFSHAMTYGDKEKEFLLDIKHGKYSLEEFEHIAMKKFEDVISLEKSYLQKKPNEEVRKNLDNIIKEIVKVNLGVL